MPANSMDVDTSQGGHVNVAKLFALKKAFVADVRSLALRVLKSKFLFNVKVGEDFGVI